MVRPTLRLSDEFGAVLKYHCTKEGKTMNQYISDLLFEELQEKQKGLMQNIHKETICV